MKKRKPQWVRFAELLKVRSGQWISVREFSQISVQHGARFNQLRAKSYVIKNRMENRDGLQFSYYRLISAPADEAGPAYPPAGQGKLFQPTQSGEHWPEKAGDRPTLGPHGHEVQSENFIEPQLQARRL